MGDQHSGGEEGRRAPRSSLFLAAFIEAEGAKAPVRIRNLSETGALIEGPAFPPVGTLVSLSRQEVEITAEIVWIAAPRCGVKFHGRVTVSEWVAGKREAKSFGQTRVDAIQAAVRSGESLEAFKPAPKPAEAPAAGLDERLAQEISSVQRLLEEVSSELIADSEIVDRHARVLQSFDIANQILGHLARVLTASDRDSAIAAIGMEELRARLLRKPD